MLRLQIREIRDPLSDANRDPAVALFESRRQQHFRLDSKIGSAEGLYIVEPPDDEAASDAQALPAAPQRKQ
jgi:hypothetical protein